MRFRVLAPLASLAVGALLALPAAIEAAETPNPSGRTTADVLAQLEAYAVPEMKAEGIPGMAYAVVKDGQVVFVKAYGKRVMTDTIDTVTTGTLFEIGSATICVRVKPIIPMVSSAYGVMPLRWDMRSTMRNSCVTHGS